MKRIHMWVLQSLVGIALTVLLPSFAQANSLTLSRGDETIELSPLDFEELPQSSYTTLNDYVLQPTLFGGVLLRDLLALIDAQDGEVFEFIALNDYRVRLKFADALKYDVLVAATRDGVEMSIRDKGPYWIIFPTEDLEPVDTFNLNHKLIWQLVEIRHGDLD